MPVMIVALTVAFLFGRLLRLDERHHVLSARSFAADVDQAGLEVQSPVAATQLFPPLTISALDT